MKKNKMLFTSLLLLLFATYSCEKEEIQPETTPFSSEILKNVNPVFLEHDLSAYKIKPIWDSFITFDNADAVEVNFTIDNKTIMPMSENQKVLGRQRLLLTLINGKINETIIEYIPSDNFKGKMKDINSRNLKSKQFDGRIIFRNAASSLKTTWSLTNGKIVAKANNKKHKKPKNATTYRWVGYTYEVCTPYYYVIIAGNGEGSLNFSHMSCDTYYSEYWEEDGPEENPVVDPVEPPMPDPTDPTDPTDPPVEDECSINKIEAQISSINVDDQIVSIDIDEETNETYTKFYSWRCIKGNYYDIISTEIGVIKKTNNPNSPKEWQSLTHSSLTPVGTMLCGSVSITSESGIGTIGIYNATMALSLGLNVTTEAAGAPINRYMYFNPIKHFNVND